MAILQQFKNDVGHLWDRLAEGWRDFRDRATHALTRYEADNERDAERSVGWGVLAADVEEHADHFDIEVELPGLDKADISVDLTGRNLVISGQKHYSRDRTEGQMRIMERAYGRFDRVIPFAVDVDAAKSEAKYKDGVLSIKLPKRQPDSRQIEVSG